MMRWIRPAGVLGFLALVLIVAGVWWLVSGWLLKASIETVGTRLVGARVELHSADLTLFPMGFHLRGLQVANPEQPMQNLVEVASASGTVEPVKLLFGQIIIDELTGEGVRFNTPRKTSGAIRKAPEAAKPSVGERLSGALQGAKGKLPTVDEILAREKLTTTARIDDLKDSEKTQRARVAEAVKSLPDDKKLKAYEQRVNELTGGKISSLGDLQQRRTQLQKLKDDIQHDRDAVVAAREHITEAKQTLSSQFAALKDAPGEDLARIRQRYGLGAAGVSNLTRLLFGDNAKQWFDTIQTWYGRLERLLPSGEAAPQPLRPKRGEGHFVRFPTAHPLPDFLVRHARASTELPMGKIAVTLTDVTPQPQVLGRPMRLDGSGRDLPRAKAVHVSGTFDHVNPKAATDLVKWSVAGWRVADLPLSKADALPLSLAAAQVDITGNAKLSGGALDAAVDSRFAAAQWSSTATQGVAAQVVDALSGIKTFTVQGKAAGTLQSPSLSLSSNLDEQIKGAVLAKLKGKESALEQKLRARLDGQVEQAAGPYKDQVAVLTDTQGTLQTRLGRLNDMLKAQLQSAVKSQEDKGKEKLKEKLKGLGF